MRSFFAVGNFRESRAGRPRDSSHDAKGGISSEKNAVYYIRPTEVAESSTGPHTSEDWINQRLPTPEGLVSFKAAKLVQILGRIKDRVLAIFELRVAANPCAPEPRTQIPADPEKETP